MFQKLPVILVMILAAAPSFAFEVGGVTVGGEVAFDYNFLSTGDQGIPFTGAAPHETYRLNQTQILAKKETDQISFLGRLLYVPASYVTATSPTTTSNRANFGTLDQIEIYYKMFPNLSIGFGRFLTTMGYESLLKSENANYGNTIAFQTIVPGYGEGLRAKYIASENLTLTASTYNQATYNAFGEDSTPTKTTEVSLTNVLGNLTFFAGHYFGKDGAVNEVQTQKSASSLWTSYKFQEYFQIALTYDSRTSKTEFESTRWSDSSSALFSYKSGNHNFALRYEIIRGAQELIENSIAAYGTANKVQSITFTDKIALNDNFKLYFEYRADKADENTFRDKNGTSSSKDSAEIFTLGALAIF